MSVEETIARQQARHRAIAGHVTAEPRKRTKPIRFKPDDVNRIVRAILADLSREIRHEVKSMPAWGRALHWAAEKIDARGASLPPASKETAP